MPNARKKPLKVVRFRVGDAVKVTDTSNDNELDGYVRTIDQKGTQVYIERFKNSMWFDQAGLTPRGRFVLNPKKVKA